MERSLFSYVWRYSRRQQLWLVFVVLASLPFYYLSLDLPKAIINGPIQGKGFETPGATLTALRVAFDRPGFLGGGAVELYPGITLDRTGTLVLLCGLFLGLVLINGAFKLHVSIYQGLLGERLLRRLRYQLVDIVLRLPLPRFQRLRASDVATMVKDEVEPLGGFFGASIVDPLVLISQATTAMVFILLQSFTLGMVAAFIVLVQLLIIPRLRRRLLILGRERQLSARLLAGRVAEIVDGIAEVRTNDASNWERAEITGRLGRIFHTRVDIYQWKFLVKFINNLLAQLTPFIFYLIGGYFAIIGRLDIGQLVAVIAAYRDLPGPLKELIDWDQLRLDAQLRYAQVLEQLTDTPLLDPGLQSARTQGASRIGREVAAHEVVMRDEAGALLLDAATVTFAPGESTAALSPVGGGADHLAEALVGLATPVSGRVLIDGAPIHTIPDATLGRCLGYAPANPYFARGTLRHHLLYGLRHLPPGERTDAGSIDRRRLAEARASGNFHSDVDEDWIDYPASGLAGPADIAPRLRDVLGLVELERDVYGLGVRGRFGIMLDESVGDRLVRARAEFRSQLEAAGALRFVDAYDLRKYAENASILENVVFGVVVTDRASEAELQRYSDALFGKAGLRDRLIAHGRDIAQLMVELFGDLEPGNPLLERIDLMAPDEIRKYQALLQQTAGRPAADLTPGQAADMLKLAYAYIEPRHRLDLLDTQLQADIVAVRRRFREELPPMLAGAVHFHTPGAFNPAASIQDNVLFGRVVETMAGAEDKVSAVLRSTLDKLGLLPEVLDHGLSYEIGTGGKGFSLSQRQKLSLARAILKRPDMLVINRGLDAMDTTAQLPIMARVLDQLRTPTGARASVFCVTNNSGLAKAFDRVLVFDKARLAETRTAGDGAPPVAEGRPSEPRPSAAELP